eukprot:785744-Amphidinium_carterae.1
MPGRRPPHTHRKAHHVKTHVQPHQQLQREQLACQVHLDERCLGPAPSSWTTRRSASAMMGKFSSVSKFEPDLPHAELRQHH